MANRLVSMAAALSVSLILGACASQTSAPVRTVAAAQLGGHVAARKFAALPATPSAPIVREPRQVGTAWSTVATLGGRPATWIAQRSGVTLLRFDQRLVHLALHAGSDEPGGEGWTYGAHIGASEVHRVVAAFNGGFKLSYGSVGFMADGRAAIPLGVGLGSIVTYRNQTTGIGAWQEGVPAQGLAVASVLQNLHLLVDHGVIARSVESCIRSCWGATLGGGSEVARSALGINAGGELVWAAGERLSPAMIAQGLVDAGVVRAVELDINPAWVAGYLYLHHTGGPTGVPVVPGQLGIPGRLLTPYGRDFFTILAK